MVKIGFLEQMNQLNSELRSSQEFCQIMTQWVSTTFSVNLQHYTKIPELRQILHQVSYKLEKEYVKKTFIENSVVSTSLAQETMSLKLSSENTESLFTKKRMETTGNKSF